MINELLSYLETPNPLSCTLIVKYRSRQGQRAQADWSPRDELHPRLQRRRGQPRLLHQDPQGLRRGEEGIPRGQEALLQLRSLPGKNKFKFTTSSRNSRVLFDHIHSYEL